MNDKLISRFHNWKFRSAVKPSKTFGYRDISGSLIAESMDRCLICGGPVGWNWDHCEFCDHPHTVKKI